MRPKECDRSTPYVWPTGKNTDKVGFAYREWQMSEMSAQGGKLHCKLLSVG